jgi:hypothetical protein
MTAGSDALGFREERLLLQLKCDFLVDDQDHTYSFQNARNCEDAAQRLQRFVHWEVSFEASFHPASSECPRASPKIKNHIGFLQGGERHL